MTKKILIALTAASFSLISTGAIAGSASLSPAFVQQATGSGASMGGLDTAAIFKPALQVLTSAPRVDTEGLIGNLSLVYQSGDFNTASIEQTGSRNVGLISQIGYFNTASIIQTGTGHQAFVSQQGRGNVAIIRQR